MKQGKVTLVGAGPGDPELLTIKAAKAIAAASLILVDDLVSDDVTALAGDSARIVHVGKRGGCKSTPQSFILKMMVNAARAGEDVVRLKGGDPFVFGAVVKNWCTCETPASRPRSSTESPPDWLLPRRLGCR